MTSISGSRHANEHPTIVLSVNQCHTAHRHCRERRNPPLRSRVSFLLHTPSSLECATRRSSSRPSRPAFPRTPQVRLSSALLPILSALVPPSSSYSLALHLLRSVLLLPDPRLSPGPSRPPRGAERPREPAHLRHRLSHLCACLARPLRSGVAHWPRGGRFLVARSLDLASPRRPSTPPQPQLAIPRPSVASFSFHPHRDFHSILATAVRCGCRRQSAICSAVGVVPSLLAVVHARLARFVHP